ncbi:hypothetical protein G7054_g3449 [Neopestalotiopsis clavispora]|nr:hypothetical protein G7054_g3449 [Neopestalotiopsis clavispora]
MEGYAKLANFMGLHDEYAIYRRFRQLNAQNLLYLQAELTHLEKELHNLAQRDSSIPDREFFAKDWWSLSQTENDNDAEQWEKVLEIREKLEEYIEVAKLGSPSPYDLAFLQKWLVRPGMGNYPLLGIDRTSYDPGNDTDLIAVKGRSTPDVFSRWLTYDLIPKWHDAVGRKIKDPEKTDIGEGICDYKDNVLVAIVRVATTVVASLLPMISVVALFFVHSYSLRLVVIILASGFFSLVLQLMTSARKIEVFAATAAYAAVNVVFLTSDITEANT